MIQGEPDFTGANCAGRPIGEFFPERGTAQVTARDAKKVCNGDVALAIPVCIKKDICLEYALDRKERFGIWGGKSERERAKILKERRFASVQVERDAEVTKERRKIAAKQGWENRRRVAVETKQQSRQAAAIRSRERSAQEVRRERNAAQREARRASCAVRRSA